ncbi:hypothetical protein Zmor_002113 [Zophobas morio]|uniref:Uncharacterized protein n=1 Tax=Zophobas morio TaxID=2755281 RepID=A0AA38J5Q9_9CUCU|nr:hypothetical protein Zmor_002113 [Zophobas morio]
MDNPENTRSGVLEPSVGDDYYLVSKSSPLSEFIKFLNIRTTELGGKLRKIRQEIDNGAQIGSSTRKVETILRVWWRPKKIQQTLRALQAPFPPVFSKILHNKSFESLKAENSGNRIRTTTQEG